MQPSVQGHRVKESGKRKSKAEIDSEEDEDDDSEESSDEDDNSGSDEEETSQEEVKPIKKGKMKKGGRGRK